MCLGNRAEISSRYINGQLRILYENARYCVEKHRDDVKSSGTVLEYATSLAEFSVADEYTSTSAFAATFDCPRVEFMCNHDVILFLDIQNGHYDLNYKGGASQRESHEMIKSCTIAFRISFSRYATGSFPCPAIDNRSQYAVDMHILDIKSVIFLRELCTSKFKDEKAFAEDKIAALEHYLVEFYLPVLKDAGRHVLYSLPDFDRLPGESFLDYSVISTREPTSDIISGVKIEDINRRFRELWLKAEEFVKSHGVSEQDVQNSFLSHIRISSKVDGKEGYTELRFGPVRVQALCKSEVILYLDILDIRIHTGRISSKPKEQHRDWRVAFIIDVVDEATNYVHIDIDTARISEVRSTFGKYRDVKAAKGIIDNVKTKYFRRWKETNQHIIPKEELREQPTVPPPYAPIEEETIDDEYIQRQILETIHTGPFELIAALTQGSINMHFNSLWESAHRRAGSVSGTTTLTRDNADLELKMCLAYFSFSLPRQRDEIFFKANFLAPKVQLVYEEEHYSVVLHLYLSAGNMKPLGVGKSLQPGSDAHTFSNWHAAFKMDLELVNSGHDSISDAVLKRLRINEQISYKQLVLSLTSARLDFDESELPGATDFDKVALEYYIQKHYFQTFERAHHQVLYSIPQKLSGGYNVPQLFTSLQFEIAPFITDSKSSYREGLSGASCTRNAIVIMGMTGDRPLPEDTILRGVNWICSVGKDVPLGTVYLSRASFLEGVLLRLLERVNHETTIVPNFWGVNDENWIFELAVWDAHKAKKGMKCNWREVTKKDDIESLQFAWRSRELWRYENDYDEEITYSFACLTHNLLTIPTKRMGECDILLSGTVKITLKCEGDPNSEDWSSEITVTWSATISFTYPFSGIQMQLIPTQIVPNFMPAQVVRGTPGYKVQTQVLEQLEEIFPNSVNLTTVIHELKESLEGTWAGVQVDAYEYCFGRPVFNRHGDLLLELVISGSGSYDASDIHGGSRHAGRDRATLGSIDSGISLRA